MTYQKKVRLSLQQKLELSIDERLSDDGDEADPTPSLPPGPAAVETTGVTVSEETRPLAKCRQLTPAPGLRLVAGGRR
jgi:hypothetical protein